ncbi:hypothetical protein BASA61_003877 [Batrachochytrium salamandrivorans]|nr:hypothetical protein BASA61_003877 [Batrachochytrium salamandrivorans]
MSSSESTLQDQRSSRIREAPFEHFSTYFQNGGYRAFINYPKLLHIYSLFISMGDRNTHLYSPRAQIKLLVSWSTRSISGTTYVRYSGTPTVVYLLLPSEHKYRLDFLTLIPILVTILRISAFVSQQLSGHERSDQPTDLRRQAIQLVIRLARKLNLQQQSLDSSILMRILESLH